MSTDVESTTAAAEDVVPTTWTGALRKRWMKTLPPEKMLPESQPAYVASWIYVFGMATIVALLIVIASGVVLTLGGLQWWHTTPFGRFMNSVHFWGVQFFFFFMIVHLVGKYFMAAWRGKRFLTWATGVVAFITGLATAFTGYTITTNFNSQWISFEAKDVMNSVGMGGIMNTTDVGQMSLWHIVPLPLFVGVIVLMHVLLVRKHGVVPPIDAIDPEVESAPAAASGTGAVAS
jgi:ubiquinol-cytochrome c reductase cytochrome b subunit